MAVSLGVFSSFAAAVETASPTNSTSLMPFRFGARSVPFAASPVNLRTACTLTSGAASKQATAASAGKGEPKGIMKPRRVSPEMQDFLGGGVTEIARTQALKEIWAYIKEHNLQGWRCFECSENHQGPDICRCCLLLSGDMKKKRFRTLNLEVCSQLNKSQNVSGDTPSHTNSPSSHSHRASNPSNQNGVSHLAPRASVSQPSNIHVTSQPSQVHTTLPSQPQTTRAQTIQPQGIQPQCPQPLPIQPQHAQRHLIQSQPTQPQEENNLELAYNMDDELFNEADVGIRGEPEVRKKRGMTRLPDVWNVPVTKRIIVKFNKAFLPIGDEGGLLTNFIAVLAKKPHLCPINYNNWHKVPKHYKEVSWEIIQSKFMIPENNPARDTIKRNCMKLLGTRFRDWRCYLKRKHFDSTKTAAQIVATAPPIVNREHFAELVSYWFSEEAEALSLRNKDRDRNTIVHTAGSKTFARKAAETEETNGFAPSRAQLYVTTHTTHTDAGEDVPVNDVAAANINAIKGIMESQSDSLEGNSQGSIFWSPNDVYSQAIPRKKWGGRVPGCGFGITPGSSGSTCNDSRRLNVVDQEEERRRDKETIRRLEERMDAKDAEMSALKEQMALFMRQQAQDGLNCPFDQTSPQACQRSSHASHDLEFSNPGNRTV